MVRLAICVNPMSGRDVRRLAARATNMTHEAKRDIVARVAAGADAVGVTDIYISREPFRIATLALQYMTDLKARVHVVDHELANDASDTERMITAFVAAGCDTVVSLGGDGTNRAIVRTASDVNLLALSTGTNNVFPQLLEPTIGGMVAGLAAAGRLPRELARRVKVLRMQLPDGRSDVGLIDAALLRNDHVGNFLPFDADRLVRILLTRAEPDSVGMSPIGGFIDPIGRDDDCGLLLEMGPGRTFAAPLSPGLFRNVSVRSHARVALGERVEIAGPGVLAIDGDRDHKLVEGTAAQITIERDGPWMFDVAAAMRHAVRHGLIG